MSGHLSSPCSLSAQRDRAPPFTRPCVRRPASIRSEAENRRATCSSTVPGPLKSQHVVQMGPGAVQSPLPAVVGHSLPIGPLLSSSLHAVWLDTRCSAAAFLFPYSIRRQRRRFSTSGSDRRAAEAPRFSLAAICSLLTPKTGPEMTDVSLQAPRLTKALGQCSGDRDIRGGGSLSGNCVTSRGVSIPVS